MPAESSTTVEIASAIMTPEPVTDLRAHLREALRPWAITLEDDSWLVEQHGRLLDVHYELVPPEAFDDRPWHCPQHACPFVGSLAGYVRWDYDFASAYAEDVRDFALALLRVGRGVTARLEDDRSFEAVKLRSFDLPGALSKWGVEDGDAMLTRDEGPYSEHVLGAIYRAMADAGCQRGHVSWMSTSHNPLRVSAFQPTGSDKLHPALWGSDGRLVDPDVALAGRTVEFWAYDFDTLDDRDFWQLL